MLSKADLSTLTSMANLAWADRNQGWWGEAEELGRKVMKRRRKVLGEAQSSTLTSMVNPAVTYEAMEELTKRKALS